MIRLLILDWGGVLTATDYDRQLCGDVAARFALPEDEVYRVWRAGKRLAAERGEGTIDAVWDEIRERFGIQDPPAVFASLMRAAVHPQEAVMDLLPALRSRVCLAMLSNSYPVLSRLVRKSCAAYFDRLFLSDETGRVKPDRDAYLKPLEVLAAEPAETLFVDDRERNLVPARELGIEVHHYQDPLSLRADLVRRGLLVS